MAGQRQPTDLLLLKGNKHLTKEEIENRKAIEVKAPADKVRAPSYLNKILKREFNKIAKELIGIGILTNLDVDSLARFIIARKQYIQVNEELSKRSPMESTEKYILDKDGNVIDTKIVEFVSETYTDLLSIQDRLFKQCRTAASDLGLTISSRCRLVVPKKEEKKPNKFSKFAKTM